MEKWPNVLMVRLVPTRLVPISGYLCVHGINLSSVLSQGHMHHVWYFQDSTAFMEDLIALLSAPQNDFEPNTGLVSGCSMPVASPSVKCTVTDIVRRLSQPICLWLPTAQAQLVYDTMSFIPFFWSFFPLCFLDSSYRKTSPDRTEYLFINGFAIVWRMAAYLSFSGFYEPWPSGRWKIL